MRHLPQSTVIALLLCWLSGASLSAADETNHTHPAKIMRAVRVNPTPPKLDGLLTDEVWQSAPRFTGFIQRDPTEGEAATESTTVQLVYDDEALYIGIQCFDREPDKIVARLTRRDEWPESDYVSVNLDPHYDHQTGFFFGVVPSGGKRDGILFGDTEEENTWDGVWEAKTAIHDTGWSVEYKIPYHVLRFSFQEEYTWGINVLRQISRKKEWDYWILVPRKDNGWVSRFGHLEGITGIHPPKHLEFLPFVLGRSSFVPQSAAHPSGRDLFSTGGLDLRYGLSSNLSLNATFNPDFGQVEADPAVLNLGVFETFFQEKRPFFLEGNTIFSATGPGIVGIDNPSRLFHSRRIGKPPGRFAAPNDSKVIDRPDGTTILGAVKLSGKTARKTFFGILEAVTANEDATIEQTVTDPVTSAPYTRRLAHRIEPMTNFFVGRVQQDVFTNSTVGATITTVNGQDFAPASVASVDSELKWKQNAYRVFTRLSGSRTGVHQNRKTGYEGVAYFSKFSGWLGGQVYADARSPGFDANDLGFMNRANRIQSGAHVYAEILHPWALARRSGFNVNVWSHWNFDRLNLKKGINFNSWHELKNYWWFNFGISREFEAMDDLVTRGGPPMVNPASVWSWSNLSTDSRKAVSGGVSVFGSQAAGGRSSARNISVWATFRPASYIQLELSPGYSTEKNFAQWITNIDTDGDGRNDRFVFGELRSQVLDITTRATVSFTPDLSLQFYVQPFVAVGDYGALKALARPASYEFTPYSRLSSNPDFHRRSLRSNLVLRWEYRPGSTLFLVWSQSRSASSQDPSFRPWQSLGHSFSDEGTNIVLMKFNYWLNL